MIDEKKIEEASYKYADKFYPKNMYDMLTEGCNSISYNSFSEGAHWAIQEFLKDLWHDANEEPACGNILVESTYTPGRYPQKCYSVEDMGDIGAVYYDWKEYIELNDVTRWLYIDDLLPKEGGEQ